MVGQGGQDIFLFGQMREEASSDPGFYILPISLSFLPSLCMLKPAPYWGAIYIYVNFFFKLQNQKIQLIPYP